MSSELRRTLREIRQDLEANLTPVLVFQRLIEHGQEINGEEVGLMLAIALNATPYVRDFLSRGARALYPAAYFCGFTGHVNLLDEINLYLNVSQQAMALNLAGVGLGRGGHAEGLPFYFARGGCVDLVALGSAMGDQVRVLRLIEPYVLNWDSVIDLAIRYQSADVLESLLQTNDVINVETVQS